MNFIDEKCMCFDDAEENYLELTTIHQEFIALVFRYCSSEMKNRFCAEIR
jgi:hypothetical protein